MRVKNFLIEILRSPDQPSGGAGAPPAASVPVAAAALSQSATPASVSSGPAGADAAPPAGTPGQAQSDKPAAAAPYWPDGLDASLRGADEKATMDNIAKVVKGYRDRDAQRLVHENVDEYANLSHLKDFKVEPAQQPYFDFLKTDPAFKTMAAAAKENGVGQKAMMEIYRAGLNAMQEAGILEPLIDPAAEKQALIPEAAKNLPPAQQEQAIERRLKENEDFLKLMETTRQLDPQVREYAQLMMFDTAKGHQFFEWMRNQIQGGAGNGPQNLGGQGGGNTREQLRAELAALNPADPNYKTRHAELQAKYQQAFG